MRVVLHKQHPNLHEYPYSALAAAYDSAGDGFENTEFEGTYMADAFILLKAIDDFEKG